jgi:L-ascorbate metabolism protein UlaG (beta-lactamase superfamily)
MRIVYLYNSGFALLHGSRAIVIDYYRDTPARGEQGLAGGAVTLEDLQAYQQVYVLSSHAHYDHFNPVVLGWQNARRGVKYIFSEDIRGSLKAADITPRITFLRKGQGFDDGNIEVKAYGSTDEGISFYIGTDGLSIFHAGDLNCWHWPEESTPEGSRQAIAQFEKEMEPVIREVQEPDVGFFPVDPRMVTDYDRGALYFARLVRPRLLVPMHFRDSVSAPAAFAEKLRVPGVRVWPVAERGGSIVCEGEGRQ